MKITISYRNQKVNLTLKVETSPVNPNYFWFFCLSDIPITNQIF